MYSKMLLLGPGRDMSDIKRRNLHNNKPAHLCLRRLLLERVCSPVISCLCTVTVSLSKDVVLAAIKCFVHVCCNQIVRISRMLSGHRNYSGEYMFYRLNFWKYIRVIYGDNLCGIHDGREIWLGLHVVY